MDLHLIENRVLALCPFVEEIALTTYSGELFAFIYPNFEALKEANIINIESEIRWYGVELYNMEVGEQEKIRGYKILKESLPKKKEGLYDLEKLKKTKDIEKISKPKSEPDDEVYKLLKFYLTSLSSSTVTPSSHVELDLGLDSLDYVELFLLIEKGFGVEIDEKIFSSIMRVDRLYEYIKKNQVRVSKASVNWEEVLEEDIGEKLLYSPVIMSAYKTFLLPLFKLYFRLEVTGRDNIPSSACIIAPIHQSMLDGFLIEATLPYKILKRSFFLAFKQVFGTSILEPVAKHGQSILIDANENLKHSMQSSAIPLKHGNNLVIFPEGARTRDRKLLEFRPFFAMLSKTYNVPIVPVVIDGSFEALGAGMLFPRPKKIKLRYLKPIKPENLTYHELTAKVKKAIEDDIKRNLL